MLQEKGSYEELMARIGYARQEAATDDVSQRVIVDSASSMSWDPADVAAIKSSVSAGV